MHDLPVPRGLHSLDLLHHRPSQHCDHGETVSELRSPSVDRPAFHVKHRPFASAKPLNEMRAGASL